MVVLPRRTVLFLLIILTIVVGYLRGDVVTLKQAFDEALANNPAVLAAEENADAASARVPSSYLWPDPSLEVMWMNIPLGSVDPADAGTRQYAVSQKIPFPGKQALKGSQMSAVKDMVDAKSLILINDILAGTERAYWTTYRLGRDRAILEESLVLLDQLLASARSRYATGTAPQAEVLRAQLARSEIEVKLISLDQMQVASRIELALLMGREASDQPQLPVDIAIQLSSIEDSFESAPAIEASQANVRLANRKQVSAWLDVAPDFMAAYRWRDDQDGGTGSSDIMLGVSLPIYVWPRTSGRIIAAHAERKAAVYSELAVRDQVQSTYVRLSAKLSSSREEIERIQSEVLPLAQQALASSRIAYETGAVEFNTLLDAEQSWRSARMSLEEARFNYQSALAELRALVGGYEIDEE